MLDEQKVADSLKKSINKALAIKKALGHYAVVWDEDKKEVVRIEAASLPSYAYATK